MDFKNWLSEISAFGGDEFRGRAYKNPFKRTFRRIDQDVTSAVMGNIRKAMGEEGKYLGRRRGTFDPYDVPGTNEVAERMAGYAPPNDPQGNPRIQRQIVTVARQELRERLQVTPQQAKLVQAITRREVFVKFVGIDENYDWALEHDPVNAPQHQEAGNIAVVFKFVRRGKR